MYKWDGLMTGWYIVMIKMNNDGYDCMIIEEK